VKSNFDRILSSEDVMRRRATLLQRMHIDGPLLILLLTLAAGSLFVLYSASGKNWDLLIKQASSFGLGLLSMVVIAQLEPRFMARWVPLGYVAGVLLLVVVDVMGHNAMGATRWINIPGVIRFQPSEFMKILMPATIAWYLSKRTLPPATQACGDQPDPDRRAVHPHRASAGSRYIAADPGGRCVRAVHGRLALALDSQRARRCRAGGRGHVVLLYA
jgi:rod shape determining protein RodA